MIFAIGDFLQHFKFMNLFQSLQNVLKRCLISASSTGGTELGKGRKD